ncbi:efflux RND transporter permease subunit [Actinoplanes sp. TRM 88003]|uniref:Efflux RND transporter permease subunit n=1 Tax=Paractinoplanes aksuensis TaxID=2939490 RepID=A0ABT1DG10_9ACTN|nr:efflux RND transporter permease subunit [Actinoplanes aksuensis]MCO8269752.1 efflux RND transporter permease subunit [Actinoplanes aksuensis]
MRRAWLTLVIAVLIGGGVIAFAGPLETTNDPTASLPSAAESTRVAELERQLPSGQVNPALIVFAKDDGTALTPEELKTIESFGTPIVAPGKDAAIVSKPYPAGYSAEQIVEAVGQLREQVRAELPPGITAQVTGGAGFTADLADSFSGANLRLLIVTVVVVALLLLITYRSPILWLVPLAVVGLADRLSGSVVAILSRHTDLAIDASTNGIITVLVFGAGTNYALLIISRYREELHRYEDRFEAMRYALKGAGPAVLASSGTVVLSLLTLLLASLGKNLALGVAGAAGIAIAAVFALFVLPPALLVCGRKLFWPFIPRVGVSGVEAEKGLWARIGRGVSRRPAIVTVAAVLVLAALGSGLAGTKLGLSQADQFRVEAEAVDGLETVSRYFPAGATDPATIMTTPQRAEEVLALVTRTPGVASARIGERTGDLASISAVLTAAPDTPEAYDTVRALRDNVRGTDALVGGSVAAGLDDRDAARRDLTVIVPAVLLVVLLVLIFLLRALVAPVLLLVTVIASFGAALGAGSWLFRHVLDYPALDTGVPLLSFLFLVALGVDYNIFLVTRAKEETPQRGTRDGMVHALAVTGGVITSAGILLAAVFGVLGVLPVITLTQIGVIVGIGVLLDTLLVRTVLVPALATMCGDRFWWPGRPAALPAPETPAPAAR